jgi:hypothetical protein
MHCSLSLGHTSIIWLRFTVRTVGMKIYLSLILLISYSLVFNRLDEQIGCVPDVCFIAVDGVNLSFAYELHITFFLLCCQVLLLIEQNLKNINHDTTLHIQSSRLELGRKQSSRLIPTFCPRHSILITYGMKRLHPHLVSKT